MGVSPYIAILVTVAAGYLIVKKYQTHMVLLAAGFCMLMVAIACGVGSVLPASEKSTGFVFLMLWIFYG